MAEEIETGKSVAEMMLNAKQVIESIEEIQKKFDEIDSKKISPDITPKIDEETLKSIQSSFEKIEIAGQKIIDTLNDNFSDTKEAEKYCDVLENIALKIDDCRTKLQSLNVGDNIDSGAVDNYNDALTQLEEKYDRVLAKLDEYVKKTVEAVKQVQNIDNKENDFNSFENSENSDSKINKQYQDTIVYIKDVISEMKITGDEANEIINNCFKDVSGLKQYQDELDNIAKKIEVERNLFQELLTLKEMAEKDEDNPDLEKINLAIDSQYDKIKTLEQQFDSVYKNQDDAIKKTVILYKSQENATQNVKISQDKLNKTLDDKQASKKFAGGIGLVTTSLRTLHSISPYAVEGISEIITQINAAKQAMTAGASAVMAYGTAVIAGFGIVVGFIVNEIQKAVDAENEARQKSMEAQKSTAENYVQSIQESISDASEKEVNTEGEIGLIRSLTNEYEELRTKTNRTVEEQKELDNIASKIAQTMNTTTQALKDQSGAYKNLGFDVENYIKQLRIKTKIEAKENILKEAYKVESEISNEDLENSQKELENYKKWIVERYKLTTEYIANLKVGMPNPSDDVILHNKDMVEKAGGDWDKLKRLESTYSDLYLQRDQALNIIKENEADLEGLYKELDNSEDKTEEYSNTVSELYSNMSNLSSAYKTVSEGGELDASTLQSLCKQYPDLANYISETGDLTLGNGEKIKETYENEKKLLIEKLTKKKKELELEKESAENKGDVANELAKVNAELEICNNLQLEASEQELNWSNISSEVKNLASAYQTLNEGKQLDIDTMISLIDKYPEVAAAMAKEGQLGKDQAEVLKQIFEAKKKEYILTQQNIIANRQSSEEDKKAAQARLKAIENYNIDSSKQSGGNTDDSNKALANELKQLEHKKAIGQLNSQQEYNWLVRINNKYRKNADEQSDMEKRLYNAKKQMQADEEAANTKALQEAYKGIENKKSLGKMNSQQELRQLEQIRQRYKMTAEERMELEIKIYNLKKSLKDDEISSINTLADAVTEALKQKYEEQRKLEEDRINESIESWQNWEDKTVSAIQGEIDALDELAKKQDSENKRQEYENKRQQTELQLAYEKDDYNRTQLQKELARLDKEEAERLAEEQREAKKKALEGRIEAVKGQSQATQERLNKELDKLGEKYEKLTDSFSLKAQAQKFIADSTQKQIISLIKSYASDYEIAGNTIGDALYNGMKAKMDNISAYVDGVFGKIEAYQRQMANTANASADRFWASQNSAQSAKKQSSQKAVTVKQTVNFNQPIESPVETRRQLDRTNQALAKQISSGI